ncbi:prepilin peptidase [Aminipila butyrica]|uniref:Prepilin peptidase n=1 Tax=Aminipila butyrica TaxID=433296 RepID=A0A858C166_9FIRM|nr:A24 family peptidase [Aminipila butyrica]QIB70196.1 prepilin peptidase [Aminipila butyrica]
MFPLFLLSLLYSLAILFSFRQLPASWLCDYGEAPARCYDQTRLQGGLQFIFIFCFTLVSMSLFLPATGANLLSPASFLLILLLAHICLSDISYQIIPDQHVGLILLMGLFIWPPAGLLSKLVGLTVGALPFLLLLLAGLLLRGQEWIGLGDVKLMGSLGFFLGAQGIIAVHALSGLLSGLLTFCLLIIRLLTRKGGLPTFLPLAPCISLAFVICCGYPQWWS